MILAPSCVFNWVCLVASTYFSRCTCDGAGRRESVGAIRVGAPTIGAILSTGKHVILKQRYDNPWGLSTTWLHIKIGWREYHKIQLTWMLWVRPLSHLFHIRISQIYILHISQKSGRQFETGNHRGKYDLIQTEWNTNENFATFWSGLPNFRTIWHMLLGLTAVHCWSLCRANPA